MPLQDEVPSISNFRATEIFDNFHFRDTLYIQCSMFINDQFNKWDDASRANNYASTQIWKFPQKTKNFVTMDFSNNNR